MSGCSVSPLCRLPPPRAQGPAPHALHGVLPLWPQCHPRCHLPCARRASGGRVLTGDPVPAGVCVLSGGCVPAVGGRVPSSTYSTAAVRGAEGDWRGQSHGLGQRDTRMSPSLTASMEAGDRVTRGAEPSLSDRDRARPHPRAMGRVIWVPGDSLSSALYPRTCVGPSGRGGGHHPQHPPSRPPRTHHRAEVGASRAAQAWQGTGGWHMFLQGKVACASVSPAAQGRDRLMSPAHPWGHPTLVTPVPSLVPPSPRGTSCCGDPILHRLSRNYWDRHSRSRRPIRPGGWMPHLLVTPTPGTVVPHGLCHPAPWPHAPCPRGGHEGPWAVGCSPGWRRAGGSGCHAPGKLLFCRQVVK